MNNIMLGEQYKSKCTVMARINGGLVIIVKSVNIYWEFSLSARFYTNPLILLTGFLFAPVYTPVYDLV
jgi:hypothetical protein